MDSNERQDLQNEKHQYHDEDVNKLDIEVSTTYSQTKRSLQEKIFLTVAIGAVYFGFGYTSGTTGPTLVHLEHLYDTNTSGISKAFIGINLGRLIGALVCAIVFDRINSEVQFFIFGILLGLSSGLIPWMPNLHWFYVITSLQYISQGFMYSGSQPYMLALWKGDKLLRPVAQCIHSMWSIGCFISPFIAIPFLVEFQQKGTVYKNSNHVEFITNNSLIIEQNSLMTKAPSKFLFGETGENQHYNYTYFKNISVNYIEDTAIFDDSNDEIMKRSVQRVRQIYAIVGCVDIFAGVLFCIGFVINCSRRSNKSSYDIVKYKNETNNDFQSVTNNDLSKNFKKPFKEILILCLFFITIFVLWQEYSLGSYLAAFTVKGLGWTTHEGAIISSVFFGFHSCGRVSGIFISKKLQPAKVIAINMSFTLLGLTTLVFSHTHDWVVYIGVAICGLSLSTTFPTLILWASRYVSITGVLGSLFIVACSIGNMSSGATVGYLFEVYSHMCVVYTSLAASILSIIIFIISLLIVKYGKK